MSQNTINREESRKVLVTGGAGFVGSHVVDKLVLRGDDVIVIDNLTTGKIENVNDKARFFLTDITSSTLSKIFEIEKPEYVIHLAAQVKVRDSLKDPIEDAKANILGTLNVLELCRRFQVKKIVYVSSAAVYGNPKWLSLDEGHPIQPLSPYGISKYVPEHYVRIYNELYGLDYTVLRYSNVYGPRQNSTGEGGVIAVFVHKMIEGQPPVIFGDGEQTRDFIYVSDAAEATVTALERGSGHSLNVSTGRETSLNQLVEMLNELGGFALQPVYDCERPGDIRRSLMDNSKCCASLRWHPSYDIERGLEETLKYYAEMCASSQQVASSKSLGMC